MTQEATGDRGRLLTVPNLLSLLRLFGVPVFVWLVLIERDGLAILVLALGGVTDWLDGQIARRLGQYSRIGELLDPFADRLYILAVLVGLAVREIVPVWFAALIPLRDIGMVALLYALRRHGFGPPRVHFLGKAATFCLMYAFPLLFLGDGHGAFATLAMVFGWAFAVWGTTLYWWAGILYAVQVRQVIAGADPDHAPASTVSTTSRSSAGTANVDADGDEFGGTR